MAAKRISKSAINWAALSERVPEQQRTQFLAFKAKSDSYLRRVLANPEKVPAIDWAFYKSRVPVAGMVDDFQKQYSALTIPFPPDTKSAEVDAQGQQVKAEIDKFKLESNARIAEYKKQLAYIASLIPFEQMTLEDFRDAFPDQAVDPVKKPSFWPHTAEEQIGYEKDEPEPSHH